MTKLLCRLLWDAAEWLGINLGPFAPWVFGKMIGAKRWKKQAISRDEFIRSYARNSGVTPERLSDLGVISLPCSCGEGACKGWQMRHVLTFTADEDFQEIPEPYRSELKKFKRNYETRYSR